MSVNRGNWGRAKRRVRTGGRRDLGTGVGKGVSFSATPLGREDRLADTITGADPKGR